MLEPEGTGSRRTQVPFFEPSSWTRTPPASRRTLQWTRETPLEAIATSHDGLRPIVTTGRSRGMRRPSWGPRIITRHGVPLPWPGGSTTMAAWVVSSGPFAMHGRIGLLAARLKRHGFDSLPRRGTGAPPA